MIFLFLYDTLFIWILCCIFIIQQLFNSNLQLFNVIFYN